MYSKKEKPQAHFTEELEVIAAMVSEANLVGNPIEWRVDIGASRHICTNRSLFKEFDKVSDSEGASMGNASATKILEKRR